MARVGNCFCSVEATMCSEFYVSILSPAWKIRMTIMYKTKMANVWICRWRFQSDVSLSSMFLTAVKVSDASEGNRNWAIKCFLIVGKYLLGKENAGWSVSWVSTSSKNKQNKKHLIFIYRQFSVRLCLVVWHYLFVWL